MLFDAHTHLNFEEYTDEYRSELAGEIAASDLSYIIDVGACVESSELALADADAYEWCYAAVGIHPDRAPEYAGILYGDAEAMAKIQRDVEAIRKLAAHPKAVAIGEIGLDFYYGKYDYDEQEALFRRQVKLACELGMPIMIHSRDAHQLTRDILIEEGAFSEERIAGFPSRPGPYTGDARVQLHCYSGSAEMAEEYVKMGATISLGGPVTFKNGKKAVEVVQRIPIEYLLSETDAPYMAPVPLRGQPNKPQYVEHVVRRMAVLKDMEYEDCARILTENGKRFFGI